MVGPGPTSVGVRYASRRDALVSYRSSREELSLFVPTDEPVETGRHVRLEVGFGDAEQTFALQGRVAFRIERRAGGRPGGLTVVFEASERGEVVRMLDYCAGRPSAMGSTVEDRVPAQIRVLVRLGRRAVAGCVRDLSASGVFVAGEAPAGLERGSEVEIQLGRGLLGLLGARRLRASVVWQGVKYGVRGFGARFVEDPARTRAVLHRWLVRAR